MRFFVDNCISYVFVEALKILAEKQGYAILHLREKFPANEKDTVWIPALQKEGDWVIISGDPRITKGKAEQAVWRESKMTAFFFGSGWTERRFWTQAEDFIHWWPKIALKAREAPTGAGFLMPYGAKDFKQIYEPLDLAKSN